MTVVSVVVATVTLTVVRNEKKLVVYVEKVQVSESKAKLHQETPRLLRLVLVKLTVREL
jgi:hypothetical protein